MQSTSDLEQWRLQAERESARLASRLWSVDELHQALQTLLSASGSPYAGIKVAIAGGGVSIEMTVGAVDGDAVLRHGPVALDPSSSLSTYKLEAFARSSAVAAQATQAAPVLVSILRDFWKPVTRDKFGLPSTEKSETTQLLETTLFSLKHSEGTRGFFVYADLDKFKELNDQTSHEVGDQALTAVSGVLANEFAGAAIPLHRGGDEFIALFESPDVKLVLDRVWRATSAIKALSFQSRSLDVTWGVHAIVGVLSQDLRKLQEEAEKATKKQTEESKEKKRGTIHFSTQVGNGRLKATPDEAKLFAAYARGLAPTPRPFGNVWLNVLSCLVCDSCCNSKPWHDTINAVSQLRGWAGIDVVDTISPYAMFGEPDSDFSTELTAVEICLAISHGLFRYFWLSPQGGNVQLEGRVLTTDSRFTLGIGSGDWSRASLSSDGQTSLISIGAGSAKLLDLGLPVKNGSPEVPCHSIAPVTLIRIGLHTKLETSNGISIPSSLFSDVISVDDRPYLGGGLPDFWEAAIARLAIVWFSRPAACRIAVVGNPDHAMQTVAQLQNIEKWNTANLAARLGLDPSYVDELKRRGVNATYVLEDSSQLIDTLYQQLIKTTSHTAITLPVADGDIPLNRTLDIDEARLALTEGLRCDTASEAYPIVLELLRKADSEYAVFDDFQDELRELANFELRLRTPTVNRIPSFYRESQNELEQYFNSVIWSARGVLGSQLRDGGQFDWLLHHLRPYLEASPFRSSTRRAILVVKNQVDSVAGDFKPLGLVCIKVAPRFRNGKRTLDFCFVWRTVEAIVGFPYSLYGSIRFAEQIVTELAELISRNGRNVSLEVGELTYIAISLHLSVGRYGLRIAKKIVDDASS